MFNQHNFKGPIEGYVVNFLKDNLWRVESTMERDDVMQDAYLVFARCAKRYPEVEPPHFMALFKTAWARHFTDLSNADTKDRVLQPITTRSDDGKDFTHEQTGETDNEGALATLIRQAPAEVTAVLNLFLNAPQELLEVALASWSGADRRCKAGGSERINRLLGLPLHHDTLQTVHDYFH